MAPIFLLYRELGLDLPNLMVLSDISYWALQLPQLRVC